MSCVNRMMTDSLIAAPPYFPRVKCSIPESRVSIAPLKRDFSSFPIPSNAVHIRIGLALDLGSQTERARVGKLVGTSVGRPIFRSRCKAFLHHSVEHDAKRGRGNASARPAS